MEDGRTFAIGMHGRTANKSRWQNICKRNVRKNSQQEQMAEQLQKICMEEQPTEQMAERLQKECKEEQPKEQMEEHLQKECKEEQRAD